jgi:hypothetical protein
MGFNTTVFILNDYLGDIRKDSDFSDKLVNMIGSAGKGKINQGCTVMPTAHADVFRLYFTHENKIVEVSQFSAETMKLNR